jgi:hypothetical protein
MRPVVVAKPVKNLVAKRLVLEAVVAKSAVNVPWPLEKVRLVVEARVAKKAVEVALPCTRRLPVVVAPPAIVRPPLCVPLPIVDEAFTKNPIVVDGDR